MTTASTIRREARLLSTLHLPESTSFATTPSDTVLLMEMLEISPVTARQVSKCTSTDPTLSRVRKKVQHGWTCTVDSDIKPYHISSNTPRPRIERAFK